MKSKRKGKVGEREVAALFRKYGFEAQRGVQYRGGPGSPDVVHSIPNVHVEVKRCEQLSLYEALDQAAADAASGQVPIVFHRRNSRHWVAVLDAEAMLQYLAVLDVRAR